MPKQETLLPDEAGTKGNGKPDAKPRPPEPVQLKSAHDYSLVTAALELRKLDLTALAKKTTAEGYPREGAIMNADALALEHHVLPAFRAQRELPLVTPEQLEKNLNAALRIPIWRAFEGLGDPKVVATFEGVTVRKTKLLDGLTTRISIYVREVAEEAYRQGMASREQTPEAIADRSVARLRVSGD